MSRSGRAKTTSNPNARTAPRTTTTSTTTRMPRTTTSARTRQVSPAPPVASTSPPQRQASVTQPRPPSTPPPTRAKTRSSHPPLAKGMDEVNARRLLDAWRAKDRQVHPIKSVVRGGFYAGHAVAPVEAEYDPKLRVLIVRRSPVSTPYDLPPDNNERARIAAIAASKASRLGGTITEIVELRSRPKKWYVVVRRDFADAQLSEGAFTSALDDLVKLMVVWRA